MDLLENYLAKAKKPYDSQALSFIAALQTLLKTDPPVAHSIINELEDQRKSLKLIASENYCSLAVQLAMGNWLTDKYAEGFPQRRFYAGCENVDAIESLAALRACNLFGAQHAFVQPHCGADANLLAFMAVLFQRVQLPWLEARSLKSVEPLTADEFELLRRETLSKKLLGMSLNSGGHLTHGYRANISSRLFQAISYDVDPTTALLDYEKLSQLAHEHKPLILLAGYSAYPRRLNFARMREIADSVGAVLIADMAHFAGLVAGGVFKGDEDPIEHAHIVTTTTHKTLRGPRSGLVLCKKEFAAAVNKACPMMMGGPLPHVMAAKAIALKEASEPSFKNYAEQICENAKALAEALIKLGHTLSTGGTDNHLMILNVLGLGLSGKQAEKVLRQISITVNRNSVPFDTLGPWLTSGIRMGTAAITTLGMGVKQMHEIAAIIDKALRSAKVEPSDKENAYLAPSIEDELKKRVVELKKSFPLYEELGDFSAWL